MPLSLFQYALLFVAAAVGGALNSVAGGGSFIAFPALLFAGVPPVPANATNTVALWPAGLTGAYAYRREMRHDKRALVALSIASLLGGIAGAVLLIKTRESTFVYLLPFLLLFATVVFTFGGALTARFRSAAKEAGGHVHLPMPIAFALQLAISVYGGYFGGGIGIMMLATLAMMGMTDIHEMNGFKVLLGVIINGAAVILFIAAGAVVWAPGVVMIVGGAIGGFSGASIARRVAPSVVRRFVLVVAWGMTAYFFVKIYVL